MRATLFFAAAIAVSASTSHAVAATNTAAAAEPAPPPVRLAVVISIDQFRADYLERFAPWFGDDGFKRLMLEGAWYQDNRYRHAVTKTAPGHATILSGTHADTNGIIGNDWWDTETNEMVASVEDADAPLIGAPPAPRSPGGYFERKSGRSPRRFLGTTVGDQLKLRFGDRSRVIAVATKDRSAILLGGRLADGAYWQEGNNFVTSTYYRAELPAWVADFNAAGQADALFGSTWERLLPADVYDAVQGPDDAPGEFAGDGLTRTFPHRFDGGQARISPAFYDALDSAPASAALLADFALAAIEAENLGRHPATDLLAISFSQMDYAGHNFGPDSHEVMDSVLRLDRVLAGLFAALDATVGREHYLVVLTADHGAAPLPEHVAAQREGGVPSGRVVNKTFDQTVEAALSQTFGAPPADIRWAQRDNFGYRFNRKTLADLQVDPADAAREAKKALLTRPEISHVFTRDELLAAPAFGDTVLAMSRRSFNAARSPDVAYVLAPYFIDRSGTGTNHGTPHDYDTQVPLQWWGAGVPAGIHSERTAVEDIARTLAAALGIPAPPQAEGRRLF